MGSGPHRRIRVAAAAYRFRESLFLLPTGILLLGVVLAEVAAVVDDAVDPARDVPFTVGMSSNAATWLLSTVAGAMITTAGVVFSLTVVSLQLASSQFSPRVMRSFIRDRLSQMVIGLLMATFVYCVLTLRHVSGDATAPAPRVSLTLAVALTLTTVLLIVAHLDHLARRLQVGEVVRAIAGEGTTVIEAAAREARAEAPSALSAERHTTADDAFVVPAPRDGWVTRSLGPQMLSAAPPHTTVRLETRTGAYIHEGEALATLWPVPPDPAAVLRRLPATVAVADNRTMQQDVDFALRQLVDVGLRALSPAVNDPTTAVEVVLRVGSLMRRLLLTDLPPEALAGPDGRVLLRPWDLRPDEYIAHAFDQLRQCSTSQPQVVAALARVLRMLEAHVRAAGRPEHVAPLRGQLEMLMDAVDREAGLHAHDVARLRAVALGRTDPGDHAGTLVQDR